MYLYLTHRSQHFNLSENYKIIRVPSDGHCMIHAWEIALNGLRQKQNKLDYEQLRELILQEFMVNSNYYSCFVPYTADIYKEVHDYLQYKCYASDVGDLVLYALSNATGASAMIYVEDKDGELVPSTCIKARNNPSNESINLLKSNQHYDVIVLEKTGRKCCIFF